MNAPPSSHALPAGSLAPMPANAIEARGLTKVYRRKKGSPVTALDNVSLAVPRGSIFGLLGPNGAGKSTFINIFAGLVKKTAGGGSIWGVDIDRNPRQARAAIGVAQQHVMRRQGIGHAQRQAVVFDTGTRRGRLDECLGTGIMA